MKSPRTPQAVLAGLLAAGVQTLPAQELNTTPSCDKPIAVVTSVQGRVVVRPNDSGPWHPARLHQPLCGGEEIHAEALSRAQVRLNQQQKDSDRDGTLLQIKENSTLVLPKSSTGWLLDLLHGAVHVLSRTPKNLTIRTLFCNAGVEGTEFLVQAAPTRTQVDVYEGRVLVQNNYGSVRVTDGEAAVTERNTAPRRELIVKPRDAVQWALYYPPIIDTRNVPVSRNATLYRQVLDRYQRNNIPDAVAMLDRIPTSEQDAYFFNLRAALYLSVGQIDKTRKDIASTTAINTHDATALSLQAIIAVVQNQKAAALKFAQEAIAAAPNAPTPYVADSYAQQASFKLDAALASARKATGLDPDNALAWARVAELELSHGNLRKADEAADKAKALDPSLARTQTISGFAALTRIDIPKAKSAFTEAIAKDPADPLPRLGLGLAKIRKGQLQEGRKDIENAANIDPDNSLVRSYLGKAYYEEKRNDLAEKEFENAKKLDPKDPTPWFYDAIRKQTENRPVEALWDLQKSIELNDNRAIYRSNLGLDQDLASRTASMSRIYRDLGYEQLALVEGWKSVSLSPIDYSAHRLLADTYSSRPRHELARVSELLQSQLLQPSNITPVQPQLAELNPLILEASGPGVRAFNEFNPLFARNRLSFQASGVFGSNNTFGDEIVHSGLFDNFSYSLGQFHYQTDGFRNNADVTHDISSAFVQGTVFPNLTLQAEYRHREFQHGDLFLSAGNVSPDTTFRESLKSDSIRAGVRYEASRNSDFLLSFIHQKGDDDFEKSGKLSPFSIYGNTGETQYLFHSERYSVVTGAGFSTSGQEPKSANELMIDNRYANGYLYSYWRTRPSITWTFGLSYDSLVADLQRANQPSSLSFSQANPKFGVIWLVTPRTTLRIAGFRTLMRPPSKIASPSIEPTQVAGFSQLFDDQLASDIWRYGLGIDHKFSSRIFAGLEFSNRDIYRNTQTKIDWNEISFRSYLNIAINSEVSAKLSYEFENFERSSTASAIVANAVNTHTIHGGLRFFSKSGLLAVLEGQYVDQHAQDLSTKLLGNVHNNFILVDASIGYRLPNRHGIITLDVKNLLNQNFGYQGYNNRTLEGENPQFIPQRAIFTRFTISF